MSDFAERLYVGDGQRHYEPLDNPDVLQTPEPYLADPALVEAVNLALYLRRPLLLEGDPGCGKTRLAYAVAYELGYPLKSNYIRSTSRAQDLLYTYDAVRRLYDIQEKKTRETYVTYGKLGEAIKLSQEDIPSVVLIDEIDKADLDFPNDLLQVLDRLEFVVDEVGETHKFDALNSKPWQERRDFLPLIIITSNREKELPKPFLRRCLFYYIDFPDQNILQGIIQQHTSKSMTPLFENALLKFWELRHQKRFTWRKIPSTSELLDWIKLLERDVNNRKLTAEKLKQIPLKQLPHLQALIKTQSDLDALRKLDE